VRAGGSDVDAYRAAKAVLDAGGVIVIFPEGMRSRDGQLQDARPGVAVPGPASHRRAAGRDC